MSFTAMLQTCFRLREGRTHKPAESTGWLHPSRFKPILRHPLVVQLLAIGFISICAFVMLESMMVLFLASEQTFNYRGWQMGLYYAYLGAIIVAVQGGFIGRLTKRFGEWALAIVGPILVCAGMLGIAIAGFKPMLAILLIAGAVNAIGRSLQSPAFYALISHHTDPKDQGLVFGLNQGLGSIARAIGPPIASVAYGLHVSGPFIVAAILALGVAIWTMLLRPKSPDDSAPFPLPADASIAESV
jgi:MFS transporter, DHA1 family, tetracycline resistance protein